MVLFYLHFIHILVLAGTAITYHRFPHLWHDQGLFFLTLAATGSACLSMIGLGIWALTTRASTSGKVALHIAIALLWAAGVGFYAYRVSIDYHLIAYLRGKLF